MHPINEPITLNLRAISESFIEGTLFLLTSTVKTTEEIFCDIPLYTTQPFLDEAKRVYLERDEEGNILVSYSGEVFLPPEKTFIAHQGFSDKSLSSLTYVILKTGGKLKRLAELKAGTMTPSILKTLHTQAFQHLLNNLSFLLEEI